MVAEGLALTIWILLGFILFSIVLYNHSHIHSETFSFGRGFFHVFEVVLN